MRKYLDLSIMTWLFLSVFFVMNANADTSTTGGSRVLENPTSNGNLILRVNVGGVKTDALTVTGATGKVAVKGTTTNDSAAAGEVGEFLSANSAGVAPAASNAWKTLASLSLTAGDWWVSGTSALTHGTISGLNTVAGSISLTNDGSDTLAQGNICSGPQSGSSITYVCAGPGRRISVASTTPVYLVGLAVYTTVGTAQWAGNSYISARRIR